MLSCEREGGREKESTRMGKLANKEILFSLGNSESSTSPGTGMSSSGRCDGCGGRGYTSSGDVASAEVRRRSGGGSSSGGVGSGGGGPRSSSSCGGGRGGRGDDAALSVRRDTD